MAPLTVADAARARAEARILRAENESLRRAARASTRESRGARSRCLLAYARLSATRARPLPSPWSDLRWRQPDDELERVLTVLP